MEKIIHQRCGYLLPMLPAQVAEILVDDGRLIPLLKLSLFVGQQDASARSAAYKVLAGTEAGTVAFPAEITCGIVAEQKGEFLSASEEKMAGAVGVFKYQGKKYNILDIDYLAMAMTEEVAQ